MSVQVEDSISMRTNSWSTIEQNQISILVVDDQRLFRESIASMLSAEPSFAVVGVAGDGSEAVELARQLRPDVIVA